MTTTQLSYIYPPVENYSFKDISLPVPPSQVQSKASTVFQNGVGNKSGECQDITEELRCNRTARCTWERGQCIVTHTFLDAIAFLLIQMVVMNDMRRVKPEYKSKVKTDIQHSGLSSSHKKQLLGELDHSRLPKSISLDTRYKTAHNQLVQDVKDASCILLGKRNSQITSIFQESGDAVSYRLWRYFLKFSKHGRVKLAERMRKKVLDQLNLLATSEQISESIHVKLRYEISFFQVGQWTCDPIPPKSKAKRTIPVSKKDPPAVDKSGMHPEPKEMDFHEWDAQRASYNSVIPPSAGDSVSNKVFVPPSVRPMASVTEEDQDPLVRLFASMNHQVEIMSEYVDPEEVSKAGIQELSKLSKRPDAEVAYFNKYIRHRNATILHQQTPLMKSRPRISPPKKALVTKKRLSPIVSASASASASAFKTANSRSSQRMGDAESSVSLFQVLEPIVSNLGVGTSMAADIISSSLAHADMSSYHASFLIALSIIQRESFQVTESALKRASSSLKSSAKDLSDVARQVSKSVAPIVTQGANAVFETATQGANAVFETATQGANAVLNTVGPATVQGTKALTNATVQGTKALTNATVQGTKAAVAVGVKAAVKGVEVASDTGKLLYSTVPTWETTKRTGIRVISQGVKAASKTLVPAVTQVVAHVSTHTADQTIQVMKKTAKTAKNAMHTTADVLSHEMASVYQSLPSVGEVLDAAHTVTDYAVQTATPLAATTCKSIGTALASLGVLSCSGSLAMAQYFMRMGALVDVTALKNVVLNSNIFIGVEEPPTKVAKDPDMAPTEKIIKTKVTSFLPMGGGREDRWRQTEARLSRANPHATHTVHVQLKDGSYAKTRRSTRIAQKVQK